jgi:hypothetical protein
MRKASVVLLLILTYIITGRANTWRTIATGYWHNPAIWSAGVVPPYSSADTFQILYPVAFDQNIVLETGGYLLIDSTGGLCGHHNITVNPGAGIYKSGILEIDTLTVPGGDVIFVPPGNTILTVYGIITAGGSLNNLGSALQVGSWFDCQQPEYAFTLGIQEAHSCASAILPNPNNGRFLISFDRAPCKADINIMDITGRRVRKMSLKDDAIMGQIDVSFLPNGIYFVEVVSEDTYFKTKIEVIK